MLWPWLYASYGVLAAYILRQHGQSLWFVVEREMWPSRPANIHEEFAYGILTTFFHWKHRTMTGLLQTLCYNMFCWSRKGAKYANGWSFEERNSTQGGAVHLWIYCRSRWERGVSYQVVHGNVEHQINDVCVCVYCELVYSVRFS